MHLLLELRLEIHPQRPYANMQAVDYKLLLAYSRAY